MKPTLQPGIRYEHRLVVPHDGVDRIAKGRHERFAIDREKFDARLAKKQPKR